MAEEKRNALNDQIAKVTAEANSLFAKLGSELDKQVKQGVTEVDVIKIAQAAGLGLNEETLKELKIERIIFCHPWIPWYIWFPWRPIWCWRWHRYYPWYHCCPWWWSRCHWHPF